MKSIIIFFTFIIFSISVHAASVELEWNMKDASYVDGYNLTMWTESGLTVTTKIGRVTSIKIDTLTEGRKYIFQITPFYKNGKTGKKSNFVVYNVPSNKVLDIKDRPRLRIKETSSK